VFAGDNAKFVVATNMPAPSYQWQEDPGTGFVDLVDVWPYSGVHTDTLTIHNASPFLNATHYRCIMQGESSPCIDTSASAILIVKGSLGLPAVAPDQPSVFPSPFHNVLTVRMSGPSDGYLELYDQVGRKLAEQRIYYPEVQMNTAQLPGGIYFLKVVCSDRQFVSKIVKE
jgi:hypothetical protein